MGPHNYILCIHIHYILSILYISYHKSRDNILFLVGVLLLVYFSKHNLQLCAFCCKWQDFFFFWQNSILSLYIVTYIYYVVYSIYSLKCVYILYMQYVYYIIYIQNICMCVVCMYLSMYLYIYIHTYHIFFIQSLVGERLG